MRGYGMRFVEGRAARMIGARLERGEDLMIAIRELAVKTGVKSGAWFAIGTLSRACFYFYRPKPMPTLIEKPSLASNLQS
jgi:predicted DNA-binding protein with PD1-like motif